MEPARRRDAAAALVKLPRAAEKMAAFVAALVELGHLEQHPDIVPAVAEALGAELPAFVRAVLAGPEPTLGTLYKAPWTVASKTVAAVYGVPAPSSPGRIELDPGQRFGLFTHVGWLSAVRDPIRRGKVLRKAVLCQPLPDPPPDVDLNTQLPATPKEWTEAEKYQVFVRERAGCAACHGLFQPYGLALETHDRSGRYREKNEHGRVIDPSGVVEGVPGVGSFTGARSRIDQIAASEVAASCFAGKYLTYVLGQPLGAEPLASCIVRDVARSFSASGLRFAELAAALAAHPAFVSRAQPKGR